MRFVGAVESAWYDLDQWGNDFEAGSSNSYELAVDEKVGPIERIDLKVSAKFHSHVIVFSNKKIWLVLRFSNIFTEQIL